MSTPKPALALPLLAAVAACATPTSARPPLTLVETAPVETTLDDPEIPAAHEVWLEMIGAAKRELAICQFYLASRGEGDRIRPVIDAVEAAARRGVRVRLIADSRFYKTYPGELDRLGAVSGIDVRIYRVGETMGGVQHAKFFVVDDREAYLGSQNFDWRSLEHIQELGVRIAVPAVVRSLRDVFDLDWALASGEPRPLTRRGERDRFPVTVTLAGAPAKVTAAHSPKGWLPDEDLWDLPKLVALIEGAERSVRVQLLSYEPSFYSGDRWTVLDDALRGAAGRGVEVSLMVSHWMTKQERVGPLGDLQQVPNLTVKIVTLPQASTGFIPFARVIHSKLLVVDGRWAWIGTSNWSGDYFHNSRNVGLIVDSPAFAARVERFFDRGWRSAYAEELIPGKSYPEPRIAR